MLHDKKQRAVCFPEQFECDIHFIERVEDMSSNEIDGTWLSRFDIMEMNQALDLTLKSVESKTCKREDLRGLGKKKIERIEIESNKWTKYNTHIIFHIIF